MVCKITQGNNHYQALVWMPCGTGVSMFVTCHYVCCNVHLVLILCLFQFCVLSIMQLVPIRSETWQQVYHYHVCTMHVVHAFINPIMIKSFLTCHAPPLRNIYLFFVRYPYLSNNRILQIQGIQTNYPHSCISFLPGILEKMMCLL